MRASCSLTLALPTIHALSFTVAGCSRTANDTHGACASAARIAASSAANRAGSRRPSKRRVTTSSANGHGATATRVGSLTCHSPHGLVTLVIAHLAPVEGSE
jgi:hypothetical protein